MSDTIRPSLDWQEHSAQIDRTLAEMGKLIEEQTKLQVEARKLRAERGTLQAQKRRVNRDPYLIIGAAIIGAIGLIAAHLPEIIAAVRAVPPQTLVLPPGATVTITTQPGRP